MFRRSYRIHLQIHLQHHSPDSREPGTGTTLLQAAIELTASNSQSKAGIGEIMTVLLLRYDAHINARDARC